MNNLPNITDSLFSMAIRYAKFTEHQHKEYPESYYYIWTKCAMMKAVGTDIYASQDYFSYPLSEWLTEDFSSAQKQIMTDLKGIKEYPIEISNQETISNLLLTMHFRQISTQMIGDIIEVEAHHLIEDDVIKLYFRQITLL